MRRLRFEEKIRLARLAKRRWSRALSRRDKAHVRRIQLRICPPTLLSFARNYKATVAFLNELRDATLNGSRGGDVYVDLVELEELSLPVAIVLAAEFHRWSLKRRRRLYARNSTKWSPQIRALFSELGVFELLNTKNVAPDEVTEDDLILTRLRSGERQDGEKIDELQSEFVRSLEGFTRRPQLFDGLSEAVENAISHAYPPDYVPQYPFAGHRWWGASSLSLSENRLRFFIFDQGAGIPFTLPKGPLWEHLVPYLAALTGGLISDDAPMLKAAFEVGRTRTGLDHRGLGLQKMAEVVSGTQGAYLRIISGKAEIRISYDGSIASKGLAEHIGGTLIEWSLPADAFMDQTDGNDDATDQHP